MNIMSLLIRYKKGFSAFVLFSHLPTPVKSIENIRIVCRISAQESSRGPRSSKDEETPKDNLRLEEIQET